MIIGLDVGGTHIDGIIILNKTIIKTIKKPVDYEHLEDDILHVLDLLLENVAPSVIKQINLSTTVITNAIVEHKVNDVGVILQTGPGLQLIKDEKHTTYFLSGYTDHRGIVVKDHAPHEIEEAIKLFKANNINYVAIASKFSTRNPNVELQIKDDLQDDFNHVSLSHTMSGLLNYPRRIMTTILNASVVELFTNFSKKIIKTLQQKKIIAPVYILKADGGLLSLDDARKNPVQTILSGPAASSNGFTALIDLHEDAVLLDIGGTTTDIFIVADGHFLFEPLGATINEQKTLIRAIFSRSIGLGGDSEIKVLNNTIVIGPKRQGQPYALGGPKTTLTDAFIYLKKLNIGSFSKAEAAMNLIAKKLKLSLREVANKIITDFTIKLKTEVDRVLHEVNNKPIYTIKELLENKIIKPQSINIIGGPAKLLETSIKKHFNIPTFYPSNYEIANAIGAALSKVTAVVNVHVNTSQKTLIIPELGKTYEVNHNFLKTEAIAYAYDALKVLTGVQLAKDDFEVIEESVFNMVDGFYTKGKNIRIKAQVKPCLIYKLGANSNER